LIPSTKFCSLLEFFELELLQEQICVLCVLFVHYSNSNYNGGGCVLSQSIASTFYVLGCLSFLNELCAMIQCIYNGSRCKNAVVIIGKCIYAKSTFAPFCNLIRLMDIRRRYA